MRVCSAALPSELSALLCARGSRPLNAGARYPERFQDMSATRRRRGAEERSPATPRERVDPIQPFSALTVDRKRDRGGEVILMLL